MPQKPSDAVPVMAQSLIASVIESSKGAELEEFIEAKIYFPKSGATHVFRFRTPRSRAEYERTWKECADIALKVPLRDSEGAKAEIYQRDWRPGIKWADILPVTLEDCIAYQYLHKMADYGTETPDIRLWMFIGLFPEQMAMLWNQVQKLSGSIIHQMQDSMLIEAKKNLKTDLGSDGESERPLNLEPESGI